MTSFCFICTSVTSATSVYKKHGRPKSSTHIPACDWDNTKKLGAPRTSYTNCQKEKLALENEGNYKFINIIEYFRNLFYSVGS